MTKLSPPFNQGVATLCNFFPVIHSRISPTKRLYIAGHKYLRQIYFTLDETVNFVSYSFNVTFTLFVCICRHFDE